MLAGDAKRCVIDGVEDLVLTHATNARLAKGQGIAQAIPGQGRMHLPKPAWLILQCVLLRCPVDLCADLDGHQTGIRQLLATRYRCNTGLSSFHGIRVKEFCGDN